MECQSRGALERFRAFLVSRGFEGLYLQSFCNGLRFPHVSTPSPFAALLRYGTELDQDNVHLIDPTETESSVMHMWEMRRNTVVRALQGAGLDTKCIYSRDRDEIFCKVPPEPFSFSRRSTVKIPVP